jgi:hypothetical protein
MARGVTPSHVGLRHGPFLNRRDTGHVRLIAAAWQSDPIAFAARAKCCHFRARCVLPEAINTMAN